MKTMRNSILFQTDSYKYSHAVSYPPGTEYVSSYIESRGGKWDKTVFFGLQIFLKEVLSRPVTMQEVETANQFVDSHIGPGVFNRDGWNYIVNELGGKLPVRIQAVPEGTIVDGKNVLVQIVNTDPKAFWLTSFLETALLRAVWYPTTVATNSYACKEAIWDSLVRTSDDPSGQINFKLHDFGARGSTSSEAAGIGGAAHLVNFMGTDTVEGILVAQDFYNAGMVGFSIPATEHSTMTTWGGPDGEPLAMKNMLDQFAKPGKLVAVVSDSYDIWRAVDQYWGKDLKEQVLQSGATLVVRPDSGDPETVPVEVIKRLDAAFGSTINSKGFKVLNPAVRVIQGDGITVDTIVIILKNLEAAGYSADNLAFGQGAGLLQKVDRDTLKFAQKANAICINGIWQDVWKQPVDQPDKKSKAGRQMLFEFDGMYFSAREDSMEDTKNKLVDVYCNGKILVEYSFDEIRERAGRKF